MENVRNITITRQFNAPLAKVWQAWTDPLECAKWWGPSGFMAPVIKMDLRVGGQYLSCMHGVAQPGSEPADFWSTGEYREIVPMEKLVCTDNFADKDGNKISAAQYGLPSDWPNESLMTVTLKDLGEDKTEMTLLYQGLSSELPADGMYDECVKGWNQSFDKMEKMFN